MTKHFEAELIERREECTVAGLAKISGLSEAELRELVEYGAIVPLNPDDARWIFEQHCVMTVRTLGRLRRAFDLDTNALALTTSLLERIHDLEAELHRLQMTIPHRSS